MNITYMKIAVVKLIITLALSLLIVSAAHATWSTVGAAGTIDNDDLNLYSIDTTTGLLVFAPGTTGVLNVKYNVTGGNEISGSNALLVRFRDNGAASRIVLQLKRYSLINGVTSTVATLDSNNFSANSAWQTQQVCFLHAFDFENHAYFINAELTRNSTTATTGLGAALITGCDIP